MAKPPRKPPSKPPRKQSGDAASTIAGRVLGGGKPTRSEIKTLAGSVLGQDEKKGKRTPKR